MAGGDNMRIQPGQTHQMGVSRTQDDAMVGYVFQRPTEPEFNTQSSSFQAKQAPRAWALADDVIVDNVCIIRYAQIKFLVYLFLLHYSSYRFFLIDFIV